MLGEGDAIGRFRAFHTSDRRTQWVRGHRGALEAAGIGPADSGIINGLRAAGRLRQRPARQAHWRGHPVGTPATTVNNVRLGSQGHHAGRDQIRTGDVEVVGRRPESIDELAVLLPKARGGYRMDTAKSDHMFMTDCRVLDGQLMGSFGDRTASRYQFTRADRTPSPPNPCAAHWPPSRHSILPPRYPVTVKGRKGRDRVAPMRHPSAVIFKDPL